MIQIVIFTVFITIFLLFVYGMAFRPVYPSTNKINNIVIGLMCGIESGKYKAEILNDRVNIKVTLDDGSFICLWNKNYIQGWLSCASKNSDASYGTLWNCEMPSFRVLMKFNFCINRYATREVNEQQEGVLKIIKKINSTTAPERSVAENPSSET